MLGLIIRPFHNPCMCDFLVLLPRCLLKACHPYQGLWKSDVFVINFYPLTGWTIYKRKPDIHNHINYLECRNGDKWNKKNDEEVNSDNIREAFE